tara:strand:+ start:7205 stop:8053 length:849 start_codon:yes stop_codon:yes gene_type:complete
MNAQLSPEQLKTFQKLDRIVNIFKESECEIRPHFTLTGGSGSGKSLLVETLANNHKIGYFRINAAALTKEGTSGNSLSKALTPLLQFGGKPVICFVDEFDKLFISGNSNSQLAHETTNGVQNEFLTVLENEVAAVYHEYGKYVDANVGNVLFVFAGAFNGEENLTLDRLRELGIKTEFLGRVGLIFNTTPMTLKSMLGILKTSPLLANYVELFGFSNKQKDEVVSVLSREVEKAYDNNTLGARVINNLIHQYFIYGGIEDKEEKKPFFRKKLEINLPEIKEK